MSSQLPPFEKGDINALPSKVQTYISDYAEILKPKNIHICDGSTEENTSLIDLLTKLGTCVPFAKHDNCYLVRTDPKDVARVESKTFICTENQYDAVPHVKEGVQGKLGRWLSLKEAEKELDERLPGAMTGRTMYVMAYSMGPVGSPVSKIGVQITDSAYVVCCMRIMTRMGTNVMKVLGDGDFVKCLHTIGFPNDGTKTPEVPYWPCNPEKTLILHFPKTREIKSYGSGYGGNSLLGKKCFALRIAGNIARDEGWLAEHMMIMGLTNPEGKKKFIAGAFPSACGKTNLAMLTPTIPGWKVECVGDDIAWMWFDKEGQLRAINPESGFFGVAPGTSKATNPIAMKTFEKDTVFTNVAETSDGDFWWEGLDPPKEGIKIKSWLNEENWDPSSGRTAAHPNSRFCAPSDHCPIMDKDWENPEGVPISAILFGGRRPTGVPLVYQSFNWQHGVFIASALSSETTAAAEFKGKNIMRDPFAMRPFFGYNFGKYLEHWLGMAKKPNKVPPIFHVNWFRVDDKGDFLWPGFGENSRVLEWIFKRAGGEDVADVTPIGHVPKKGSLNIEGLGDIDMEELFSIPKEYWLEELQQLRKYWDEQVGEDLPTAIMDECKALEERLKAS